MRHLVIFKRTLRHYPLTALTLALSLTGGFAAAAFAFDKSNAKSICDENLAYSEKVYNEGTEKVESPKMHWETQMEMLRANLTEADAMVDLIAGPIKKKAVVHAEKGLQRAKFTVSFNYQKNERDEDAQKAYEEITKIVKEQVDKNSEKLKENIVDVSSVESVSTYREIETDFTAAMKDAKDQSTPFSKIYIRKKGEEIRSAKGIFKKRKSYFGFELVYCSFSPDLDSNYKDNRSACVSRDLETGDKMVDIGFSWFGYKYSGVLGESDGKNFDEMIAKRVGYADLKDFQRYYSGSCYSRQHSLISGFFQKSKSKVTNLFAKKKVDSKPAKPSKKDDEDKSDEVEKDSDDSVNESPNSVVESSKDSLTKEDPSVDSSISTEKIDGNEMSTNADNESESEKE